MAGTDEHLSSDQALTHPREHGLFACGAYAGGEATCPVHRGHGQPRGSSCLSLAAPILL